VTREISGSGAEFDEIDRPGRQGLHFFTRPQANHAFRHASSSG
jgi:hypothetical protein